MRKFMRYDDELTSEETNAVFCSVSKGILAGCVSEPASNLRSLIESGDIASICSFNLSLCELPDYRKCRQVLAFFTKRDDLDIGVDTRSEAEKVFHWAEAKCKETNDLFRSYSRGGFYFHPRVESILYVAQRKISRILGDVPNLEELKLRFGPGATDSVRKAEASARRKLSKMFSCSEEATRFLPELLAEVPLWSQAPIDNEGVTLATVSISRGRVAFVPKNCKTMRTVVVEPLLNSFVQTGIGDYMARRLALSGVDIRDQTRNQRLACEGSITGALATLDLSSASDLIAAGLVESLLPLEWWDLLRTYRTKNVVLNGRPLSMEKFSSMGNGFTFPLETLIFYSLAAATVESLGLPNNADTVAVYGDDIIVPVTASALLEEVLTCCGFVLNKTKSFSSGPFRESCGKDYYVGIDVRPCYQKHALSGSSCFVLHNFFVRTGQPELASLFVDLLDTSLRIYGPDGFGDGHLLGDWIRVPVKREYGWSGYAFDTYTYKARKAFYALGADYVFPAYSTYLRGDAAEPMPEGAVKFYRSRRSHGGFRPDQGFSQYVRRNTSSFLVDALPGIDGYNRRRIYTLSPN